MKLSCHVDLRDFLSFKQKMPRALYFLFLGLRHVLVKIKGIRKAEGRRSLVDGKKLQCCTHFLDIFRFLF